LNLTLHEYAQPLSSTPFEHLIDHYKPSFVHIHYWGDCDQDWYEHIFHACEAKGVPVIQNINTPVAPYASPAIRRNVYVSDYVRETFGKHDAQGMIIHPGSDLDHFSVSDLTDQSDDCIGMVYRLETDKLNSSSIDVFIKVAQLRPATRCLIVGDGSLKPIFEQMVARAGVSDQFTFTGFVPYQDLPSFYRQMSLFVAPVWKESFGQVSPFAMNMGLPIVGYSVGAIPSIIGDEKLLAQYGDSDGLAQLIIALLDDRPKRLEIGKRNHDKAQNEYSVAAMIKGYSDLYASMGGGELQ
jgi:glycosyltransferase involved in cell wall biosynthesis